MLAPPAAKASVRAEYQAKIKAAEDIQVKTLTKIYAARPAPVAGATARQGHPSPNAGAAHGTPLSETDALDYLKRAGGDKVKARELAKADGRGF